METSNIRLRLNKELVLILLEKAREEGLSLSKFCNKILQDYIAKNSN